VGIFIRILDNLRESPGPQSGLIPPEFFPSNLQWGFWPGIPGLMEIFWASGNSGDKNLGTGIFPVLDLFSERGALKPWPGLLGRF